ncbi:hypothetical protein ACG7TL_004748 [Trametes sanguinea]
MLSGALTRARVFCTGQRALAHTALPGVASFVGGLGGRGMTRGTCEDKLARCDGSSVSSSTYCARDRTAAGAAADVSAPTALPSASSWVATICHSLSSTSISCAPGPSAGEVKRVARKIAARVRPVRSDSDSQEEPRIIPGKGRREDTSNILQFNCPEVLDFSSASDWKAFWEKWMQQANRATEVHDNPPPAYTPREADIEVSAEKEALKQEPQEPVAGPAVPVQSAADPELRVGVERVVAHPVEYPDLPIPEEEVQLYDYRPTRKPARRAQKKLGFAWAFLQAVRIALHATRAVVTLKVGMRA